MVGHTESIKRKSKLENKTMSAFFKSAALEETTEALILEAKA